MESIAATLVSTNEHKARELEQILQGWTIDVVGMDELPPETGTTYYENALAKARFGRAAGAPERWMLGEDSGIEVRGLDGGPGVRSARYAAGDPVGRLLADLASVEGEGRRARYVCELVAIAPDGRELRGTGTLEGTIAGEPRGSGGFGYDPIFVPAGETRTVAELGDHWKGRNSHRARAARALEAQRSG